MIFDKIKTNRKFKSIKEYREFTRKRLGLHNSKDGGS